MEKFITFWKSMPPEVREAFAARIPTSVGYINKAISVGQRFGAEICVGIERESDTKVTRRDLRPDDWHRIWPELSQADESK